MGGIDDSAATHRPRRRWGGYAATPAAPPPADVPVPTSNRQQRRWNGGRCAPADGLQEADAALLAGQAPNDDAAIAAAAFASEKRRRALQSCGLAGLGVQLAEELFHPRMAVLSHETRGDLAALGQTSTVVTTQKLCRDFEKIGDGNAVYWPQCMCSADDLSMFKALHEELAPWEMSPYRRSRHPACIEEQRLLGSAAYRQVVAELREIFDIKVGYSIVNLYADGNDWTDYHRDNYRAEGNRMTASGAGEAALAHNVSRRQLWGCPRSALQALGDRAGVRVPASKW